MTFGRQRTGSSGEEAAAEHLRGLGWRVLERNARTRYGELDLIAHDGRALVFVEVKSRRGGESAAALALESVSPRKRAQVRRLARAWLAERPTAPPPSLEIRFDAIGVAIGPGGPLAIEHVEAAF